MGVISLLISINSLAAGTVKIEGDGAPTAVVVKMHADWCPSCKALEPTLAELKKGNYSGAQDCGSSG